MKNKGFTLIELLAVIVILAIIALIAVPIVLNIIKDSKESATVRSVELYLDAVELAVAQSIMKSSFPAGDVTCTLMSSTATREYDSDDLICVQDDNYNVFSEVKVDVSGEVPIKGKIKFRDGRLIKSETQLDMPDGNKYIYNASKLQRSTQMFAPYYYTMSSNGSIGSSLPEAVVHDPTKLVNNPGFYIGLDSIGSMVTSAYLCFQEDNVEYCLKSSPNEFSKNTDILNTAFSSQCSDSDTDYECLTNSGLYILVTPNGSLTIQDAYTCEITAGGVFSCE